jgi:hypothetical protein
VEVSGPYYPKTAWAFAAEAKAIVREKPVFNGRWNFRHEDVQKYICRKLPKSKRVKRGLQ